MTRFIVIILLLGVFFFGGMTYGSSGKQAIAEETNNLTEQEMQIIENVDIIPYETEVVKANSERDKVNKTANFFEKVVNSFYEGVITILYSIAGLFFD